MTSGQSRHFFQSLSVVGHCASVNQFTGRQQSEWLYFLLSPMDKSVSHCTRIDNRDRELSKKDEMQQNGKC